MFLLALGLTRPAFAEDALTVELFPRALEGDGQPGLLVHAKERLGRVTLLVTRELDGKLFKDSAGPIAGGRSHRFTLPFDRAGTSRFVGHLRVEWGQGESGELPISVDAALLEKLALEVRPEDLDLEARRLKLRTNRPVTKVEVSLMSDAGTPLGFSELEWGGHEVGGALPIDVEWTSSGPGNLMRIHLKGYDQDGFYGGLELFPWRIDIPHEELNFATGSSEITKAESAKLEKSYELLSEALTRYGRFAKVRLFVAGHTDTVGDVGSNRVLSADRARAIGRWFRRRGVKVPVLYAGFGEDRLAVTTPDDTDEPKNRRAEYIVAVEAPGGAAWRPLD